MLALVALIVLGPFAYLYWWKDNERAAWHWLGWSALALEAPAAFTADARARISSAA